MIGNGQGFVYFQIPLPGGMGLCLSSVSSLYPSLHNDLCPRSWLLWVQLKGNLRGRWGVTVLLMKFLVTAPTTTPCWSTETKIYKTFCGLMAAHYPYGVPTVACVLCILLWNLCHWTLQGWSNLRMTFLSLRDPDWNRSAITTATKIHNFGAQEMAQWVRAQSKCKGLN